MVSGSTRSIPDLEGVGTPSGGSVCNEGQRQATCLRIAASGRISVATGCSVSGLDGTVGVCLPPNTADSQGPGEFPESTLRTSSFGSALALPVMAPAAAGSHRRLPTTSSGTVEPTQAAPEQRVLRESGEIASSRIQTLCTALVAKGFSQAAAERISSSQREGSQAVYDGKWLVYSDWCNDKGQDPLTAFPPVIAEFLTFLFVDKKSAPSTIRGYRTVLNNVLQEVSGLDLRSDSNITRFLLL